MLEMRCIDRQINLARPICNAVSSSGSKRFATVHAAARWSNRSATTPKLEKPSAQNPFIWILPQIRESSGSQFPEPISKNPRQAAR